MNYLNKAVKKKKLPWRFKYHTWRKVSADLHLLCNQDQLLLCVRCWDWVPWPTFWAILYIVGCAAATWALPAGCAPSPAVTTETISRHSHCPLEAELLPRQTLHLFPHPCSHCSKQPLPHTCKDLMPPGPMPSSTPPHPAPGLEVLSPTWP